MKLCSNADFRSGLHFIMKIGIDILTHGMSNIANTHSDLKKEIEIMIVTNVLIETKSCIG